MSPVHEPDAEDGRATLFATAWVQDMMAAAPSSPCEPATIARLAFLMCVDARAQGIGARELTDAIGEPAAFLSASLSSRGGVANDL